jgi:ethanolamine utilization protein EutQ (cupin superfamily)
MKENLFDIPESESPRLKWMKKHGIKTFCSGKAQDFDGKPWNCWTGDLCEAMESNTLAIGETEADTIAAWAKINNVRLWNEE